MMLYNQENKRKEETTIKLQKVYVPFLLTSIGTVLLYNLWRWSVEKVFIDVLLKNEHLNYLFPFLFSCFTALLFLRNKAKLLKSRRLDGGAFGLLVLMILAVTVPVMVSQNYTERASFNVISVNNILEIEHYTHEKYFKITSFHVDKTDFAWHVDIKSANKTNTEANVTLFLACKFKDANRVWYGWQYHELLSRTTPKNKILQNYNNFLETAQEQFKALNIQNVSYFEKLSYSDYRNNYIQAITSKFYNRNGEHQIILVPHTEHFESRLGSYLFGSFAAFGLTSLLMLFIVNSLLLNREQLHHFEQNKSSLVDDIRNLPKNTVVFVQKITKLPQEIQLYLNPNGPHKNTAILLLVNIAVVIRPLSKVCFRLHK